MYGISLLRLQALVTKFEKKFGAKPKFICRAPGRVGITFSLRFILITIVYDLTYGVIGVHAPAIPYRKSYKPVEKQCVKQETSERKCGFCSNYGVELLDRLFSKV